MTKFTIVERNMIDRVIAGVDDFDELGRPLIDKLYEHFSTNGDMPYGVQKARTGDPEQWICEHLGWLY